MLGVLEIVSYFDLKEEILGQRNVRANLRFASSSYRPGGSIGEFSYVTMVNGCIRKLQLCRGDQSALDPTAETTSDPRHLF